MFSTVPMKKVALIILERDELAVLRAMGSLGIIQLIFESRDGDYESMMTFTFDEKISRCRDMADRIDNLRRLFPTDKILESDQQTEMTMDEAQETLVALEQRTKVNLAQRDVLVCRRDKLSEFCQMVSPFVKAQVAAIGEADFSFLHFVTGSLPRERLLDLPPEIQDNMLLISLEPSQDKQPLLAFMSHNMAPALETKLKAAGFESTEFNPIQEMAPGTWLTQRLDETESLNREIAKIDEKLESEAAGFSTTLGMVARFVSTESAVLNAQTNFLRTQSTVLITGWIPAQDTAALEDLVDELTQGHHILEVNDPANIFDEGIPVLLRHHRLLQPFSLMLTAYGLPQYNQLEPTLIVAISYLLMFGMMFGDVGHGIVLALAGLFTWRRSPSASTQSLAMLLLSAGAVSCIFGLVYGSYFGLHSWKKYALWQDPLEGDPVKLMLIAVSVGIVIINIGIILNIINRVKYGDVPGALLDKFGVAGLIFYGMVLTVIIKYVRKDASAFSTNMILFLLLPVLAWILEGPLAYLISLQKQPGMESRHGLGRAFAESVTEAFEALLAYLANTISFVRLAAYAMSHAALLMAMESLATQVGSATFVGKTLYGLVLVLGNVIIIIIEGVIASIQALRLEYYEFFGKFHTGRGQPFSPFLCGGSHGKKFSRLPAAF